MRPEQRDVSYLWDMLEGARAAVGFTRGVSLVEYSENLMMHLAVERAIQNIGEAANRVSPSFQQSHPEIPWRRIVAQRHVLVHEYGEIEHALIWDLVQRYLPSLIERLEGLVPSSPQEAQDS
jgi:uncharacterized protein with HEPN domain